MLRAARDPRTRCKEGAVLWSMNHTMSQVITYLTKRGRVPEIELSVHSSVGPPLSTPVLPSLQIFHVLPMSIRTQ